jgi:AraC-like DNA-binding protein
MDPPRRDWYFSTMGRRPPVAITFHRTKYGRELLVDASWVSDLPGFERTGTPHRLDFYDILLLTRARGSFAIDGTGYPATPGTVFCTAPGEIRCWKVRQLEGACVFFTADFLSEAFADARLLELFACFAPGRPSPALQLSATQRDRFLARFEDMREEIAAGSPDAAHALRALLYQLLVLLKRWYSARYGEVAGYGLPRPVRAFRGLLDEHYGRLHGVSEYAGRLGITPGYLSYVCRNAFGVGAGTLIRRRILLEAKRMLLYGELPVATVGRQLGFPDPAYFARFFRRMTGRSPRDFRNSERRPA